MAAVPIAQPRARAVSDRDEIAAFLRTDRRYAAYPLGDLDSAMPICNSCTAAQVFRPDEE